MSIPTPKGVGMFLHVLALHSKAPSLNFHLFVGAALGRPPGTVCIPRAAGRPYTYG